MAMEPKWINGANGFNVNWSLKAFGMEQWWRLDQCRQKDPVTVDTTRICGSITIGLRLSKTVNETNTSRSLMHKPWISDPTLDEWRNLHSSLSGPMGI